MARTRVVVRRNGRVVGQMTYGSEAEAVAHAAQMQNAASGLEALLAPAPAANRKRKRTPRRNPSDAVFRAVGRYVKSVNPDEADYAKEAGFGSSDLAVGKYAYQQHDAEGWDELVAHVKSTRRRNPSIGRGTAHRDRVEAAIERRLRAEGEPKATARSRAYAIATAQEQRRQGLRTNPTPIDIGSLAFDQFKKTVIIDTQYPTRSGRRFARVISKDGTFVTDVPISDGGISGGVHRVRGADAIKRRAWEQLRVHLKPSTWKPSVRVNPAGSVAYGGATIRISDGTYTVMPHGPSFKGPDGFVSAKRWIDTHGA